MALFGNSDYNFYGGNPYSQGYGSYGYNPYQGGMTDQVPASQPAMASLQQYGVQMPITARGFFDTYLPEVGGANLTKGLRQGYTDFLSSSSAGTLEGVQSYINSLRGNADVQQLARQQDLGYEAAVGARSDEAMDLGDWVTGQLGTKGSQLANLYGGSGFGAEAVTQDLTRFFGGEMSGIGDVADMSMFGKRGLSTDTSRQAVLAQLFGDQQVNIGDQSFNPFSMDIAKDEYKFGAGKSALQGTDLLRLTGGILSTQNQDITGGVAGAFKRALETGADLGFGGAGGVRMTEAIGQLTGLKENESIQQKGQLGNWIDSWFNQKVGGKGYFSFLPEYFAKSKTTT